MSASLERKRKSEREARVTAHLGPDQAYNPCSFPGPFCPRRNEWHQRPRAKFAFAFRVSLSPSLFAFTATLDSISERPIAFGHVRKTETDATVLSRKICLQMRLVDHCILRAKVKSKK